MLNLLKDYKGAVEVNGQSFDSLDSALKGLKNFDGQLTIVLNKGAEGRVYKDHDAVDQGFGIYYLEG